MTSKEYKNNLRKRAEQFKKNTHNSYVRSIIEIVLMNTVNDWDGVDSTINKYIDVKAANKVIHEFVMEHPVYGITEVPMKKQQIRKFLELCKQPGAYITQR